MQWSQIDHIAVSFRWRGCVQNCRSYWNSYVDSDHALLLCRFKLRFSGRRRLPNIRLAIDRLNNLKVKNKYQDNLAKQLETITHADIDAEWNRIEEAIRSAASNACGVTEKSNAHDHWISTRAIQLMEQRRQLPFEKGYNSAKRSLKRQLNKQLKMDREAWWNEIAGQMEIAAAAGNSGRLFKLIRNTGGRRNYVSETIHEPDGTLIVNRNRRLVRWMEHFRAQFNWPSLRKH